jgi:hypothetical protein
VILIPTNNNRRNLNYLNNANRANQITPTASLNNTNNNNTNFSNVRRTNYNQNSYSQNINNRNNTNYSSTNLGNANNVNVNNNQQNSNLNSGLSFPTQTNDITNTDEYKWLRDAYASAQSNVNQSYQLANKYAQTTAQAQGFNTQGALLQNNSELFNIYQDALSRENINYQDALSQLTNQRSDQALSNFETGITNLVGGGAYTEEDLQELIDLYMPRMDADAQAQAKYLINQLDTSNIPNMEGRDSYGDFSIEQNYIDSLMEGNNGNYKIDNSYYDLITVVFGNDIRDQSLGKNAVKTLGYFADDMKNNPQSLEGKYFNMNYGAGKKKIYYVHNGQLYKVNHVPGGTEVINIKDYYNA